MWPILVVFVFFFCLLGFSSHAAESFFLSLAKLDLPIALRLGGLGEVCGRIPSMCSTSGSSTGSATERKKTESRAGPSTVKVKKEDEARSSTLYPPRSTGAMIHPP